MNKIIIALVGAGGFGSEVMPILKKDILQNIEGKPVISFVDSNPQKRIKNDLSVMSEKDFFSSKYEKKLFNITIADSKIREKLSIKFEMNNSEVIDIISQRSTYLENINFGKGCIVFPNSFFTSNIQIGNFLHCYHHVSIAHDCKIGNFVTIAPGALINGNVTINNHAYIGSGAVIKQGITIGSNATVGMGSVVTKDVIPGSTVIGNPAKLINS